MAKKTKAQLATMGKKITTRARAIRKKKPSMKWTSAMKQAGKELKGKL